MSLTENIVLALADSAEIIAFCQVGYGKDHLVHLGVDLDNPPDEEEYPIVMISKVGGSEGKTLSVHTAQYIITCGLVDWAAPVTVGRIKRYNQLADLESFCQLVKTAVEAADLSGGYVSQVEIDDDPLELLPIFSCNMVFTINYPSPMRGLWVK